MYWPLSIMSNHWSHSEAHAATAKQTRELMGVEFGAGIYFKYLFMLAWAYDSGKCGRHSSISGFSMAPAPLLAYMLFIAFNGVIVFKSGALRWAARAPQFAWPSQTVVEHHDRHWLRSHRRQDGGLGYGRHTAWQRWPADDNHRWQRWLRTESAT